MLLSEWISNYETMIGWMGALSVLMFVGSLLAIPIVLIKMPADYFSSLQEKPPVDIKSLSVAHLVLLIAKNMAGMAFVFAGVIMLLLPGQGILTILVGMSLLNIPGKYLLIQKIIRNKTIHSAINSIRAKADKPPIDIPD